ncbi:hypothetical protein JCM10213_001659 [Rhodosporidiobolus nylandii]
MTADPAVVADIMARVHIDREEQIMTRPGLGTVGRPFPVSTNAYEVKPPSILVHHYDVQMRPNKSPIPPRLAREIWGFLDKELKVFGNIAVCYDGRGMAYSPRKLPADEGQWNVILPDEEGGRQSNSRAFTVNIKYIRSIDLARLGVFIRGELKGQSNEPDPNEVQSAIQALNVLISHGPSMVFPARLACFFLPPADPEQASPQRGLTMWRGFYSSLRMGPSKLFLNLDIASQPMIQAGNLPDVVLAFLRGTVKNLQFRDVVAGGIPPKEMILLNRHFKGCKVKLTCSDADGYVPTRKIKSIENYGADSREHMFEHNGTSVTIQEYFRIVYNVHLLRPDFPVVSVSSVARWPLEVCAVEEGQKYTKKLNPDQTADAIRLTTVAPRDRQRTLSEGLQRIIPVTDALEQWDCAINPQPLEAQARLLDPPVLNYGNQRQVRPNNGVWDVRSQRLLRPAVIQRWIVMVFDQDTFFRPEDAQNGVIGIIGGCESLGPHYCPRGADIPTFIRGVGSEVIEQEGMPPDLMICFLPRKPCDAYGEIKR